MNIPLTFSSDSDRRLCRLAYGHYLGLPLNLTGWVAFGWGERRVPKGVGVISKLGLSVVRTMLDSHWRPNRLYKAQRIAGRKQGRNASGRKASWLVWVAWHYIS